MKKLVIILFLGIFLGFAIFQIYNSSKQIDMPSKCYTDLQPSMYFLRVSPMPVNENSITRKLTIDFLNEDLFTSQAADTGSMRPTISDKSILILIKPDKEQIKIGDIISIEREDKKDLLHRVVDVNINESGTFYITKGDNNMLKDKQIWTFEQVNGKVIGVLY